MDAEKVKLAIAPIAWTNDDMPDLGAENTFAQCVSEMALAGFSGCEVGNKYPKDPAVLKRALDLRGLRICNQWFSSFLLTQPFEEVADAFVAQCEFLRAVGADRIGASEQSFSIQGKKDVPVFGNKYVMTDGEWETFADGMNRLGAIAKRMGLKLVYHHHMGTVVQTAEEVDRMMEMTDPEAFGLLFDSGHLAYCGEDALEVLKRHSARARHVHLKDVRPDVVAAVKAQGKSFLDGVRMGTFTVPGDGAIDFAPIFSELDRAVYRGWMVVEAEQDPAIADPLEYAPKARAYIREKAGI